MGEFSLDEQPKIIDQVVVYRKKGDGTTSEILVEKLSYRGVIFYEVVWGGEQKEDRESSLEEKILNYERLRKEFESLPLTQQEELRRDWERRRELKEGVDYFLSLSWEKQEEMREKWRRERERKIRKKGVIAAAREEREISWDDLLGRRKYDSVFEQEDWAKLFEERKKEIEQELSSRGGKI